MAEHRSAGIAGAAQGAGGDGLHAVEQLKERGDKEQRDRGRNQRAVRSVNAHDRAWNQKQEQRHAAHEAGAKQHGGPASAAGGVGIAASEALSDADRCGGADAQRNHVSEADRIQRDLMAGERNGAEARDQRGSNREDAYFQTELRRGGKTKPYQFAEAPGIRQARGVTQTGFVAVVVIQRIGQQHEHHVGTGEAGGPSGADGAHGRKAEMAVNQRPIPQQVHQVRGDQRKHDRLGQIHPLQIAAKNKKGEQRERAPVQGAEIWDGLGQDRLGDIEMVQHSFE